VLKLLDLPRSIYKIIDRVASERPYSQHHTFFTQLTTCNVQAFDHVPHQTLLQLQRLIRPPQASQIHIGLGSMSGSMMSMTEQGLNVTADRSLRIRAIRGVQEAARREKISAYSHSFGQHGPHAST
jgi:hypothetical protein